MAGCALQDFGRLLRGEAGIALQQPLGVGERDVERADGLCCHTPPTHVTNLPRSLGSSPRRTALSVAMVAFLI